jgi:hypothetical protein
MKVIGDWKRRTDEKRPRQVQYLTYGIFGALFKRAQSEGKSLSDTSRDLWQAVIDAPDAEVVEYPTGGAENLITVSITEAMFQEIEQARGDIPRGTFLRSMTAAGLALLANSVDVVVVQLTSDNLHQLANTPPAPDQETEPGEGF